MNEDDTPKHIGDVQDAAGAVPYKSGDGKRINRVQRPTGTSGDPMGYVSQIGKLSFAASRAGCGGGL